MRIAGLGLVMLVDILTIGFGSWKLMVWSTIGLGLVMLVDILTIGFRV